MRASRSCSAGPPLEGKTYAYAVNTTPFPASAQVRLAASAELHDRRPRRQRPSGPAEERRRRPVVGRRTGALRPGGRRLLGARRETAPAASVAVGQCRRVDRAADSPARRPGRRAPQSAAPEGPGKPRLPKQAERSRSRARLGRLEAAGSFDHHRHHAGTRDRSCDRKGFQGGAVGKDLQRRADRLPGKPAVRPPSTGRITMSVWLRVADAAHQPNVRLAVEGKLVGRDYYRYAVVGQPPGPGTGRKADCHDLGPVHRAVRRSAAGRPFPDARARRT